MTNILQNYHFVKQKPNQIIDFPRSNVGRVLIECG